MRGAGEVQRSQVVPAAPGDPKVPVVQVEAGVCAPVAGGVADHRRWPRRRGAVLENAIAQAVVDELGDRGYAGLTFEGVAARAGTGKSALYRRWSDKRSMVVDILGAVMPDASAFQATGSLRGDLLQALGMLRTACEGPLGLAALSIASCKRDEEEFARLWREDVGEPWTQLLNRIVADAIARGEARPGAAEEDCVFLGPEIVSQRFVMRRQVMADDEVVRLVDNVLVPMMEVRGD